jgi:hypothetical protein
MANLDHRIAQLLAGGTKSAAKISAALTAEGFRGASVTSVKRYLRNLRAPAAPVAPRTSKPSAPAPPPAPVFNEDDTDPRAEELEAAIDLGHAQGDHVAVAAACRAAALYADEHAADAVAEGATYVDALLNSPTHGTAVLGIGSAADFAELARHTTDVGYGYEKEEGESDEAFAVFLTEKKAATFARAVALLEAAIVIVRAEAAS